MSNLCENQILYNEAQTIKHSSLEVQAAVVFLFTPQPLLFLSLFLWSFSVSFPSTSLAVWGGEVLSFSPLFLLSLQTSRKCLEYHCRWKLRCRCASVGGAAEPSNMMDSESSQPESRMPIYAAAYFLVAGASLLFFPQELQVMTMTLNPHRLSLGILLQNGVHNKLTNLIHSLICMIGSLWTFFTSWSSVNLLYILRHIQILCFE